MNVLKILGKKLVDNIGILFITFYSLFLCTTFIFAYITNDKVILYLLPYLSIGIFFFWKFVLQKINRINIIKPSKAEHEGFVFFISGGLCYLYLLFWYKGYEPGFFSPDSINQVEQALKGVYNDWHPALHTLLFFKLPLTVTGQIKYIIPFQMLLFSCCCAYMNLLLYRYGGLKCCILSSAYILLNPYTTVILLYPWKDVGFAMASYVVMLMIAELYFSEAKIKIGNLRCICLSIMLCLSTLLRHNGILFSGMALILIFAYTNKVFFVKILTTTILLIIFVKGPLYYYFNVEKSPTPLSELMGVPLNIISNVAKQNPDAMDDEMNKVAFAIANKNLFEMYKCGNFHTIKWNGAELKIIDESNPKDVLRITQKYLMKSPKEAIQAVICLTDMVYGLFSYKMYIEQGITQNCIGIRYKGKVYIKKMLETYTKYAEIFFRIIGSIGFAILIMLLTTIGRMIVDNHINFKKILIVIPILSYDFMTMLLLTSHDSSRFFFVSILVCPIVVCMGMYKHN